MELASVSGNTLKYTVSSPFLDTLNRNSPHTGIDISLPEGSQLQSVVSGYIEKVFDYGSENAGKGIIIQGNDGNEYVYGHMSQINVKEGQSIQDGQMIGLSGNTGHSTGSHLHFAVKNENGTYIDPTEMSRETANFDDKGFFGSIFEKNIDTMNNSDFNFWEMVADKVANDLSQAVANLMGNGFVYIGTNIPEIMTLGTVLAGVVIMISGKVGKSIVWWSISMGVAVLWRLSL